MEDAEKKEQELLDKTAKRMEEIGLKNDFGDDIEEENEEIEDNQDDDSLENKDDKEENEESKTDEDVEARDEEESLTLPDALRRSAIHNGWTQEEIESFIELDPEKAVKTFEKIHESSNKLTTEFSKLGKTALEEQNSPQSTTDSEQDITKIVEKLGEEHSGDPLFEKVVKPLAQELQRIRNQGQERRPVQKSTPVADDRDGLIQQINEFWSQDTLRSYDDFYGTPGYPKTNDQLRRYNDVLILADQIMAGGTLQKVDISVPEALEKAHLVVADEFRKEATTNYLKKIVEKRKRGIQLRPNSTSMEDKSGLSTPKNRDELHKKTKERLHKVFG